MDWRNALAGRLVVSCQAPVRSPLHEPSVIAAMAAAAVEGGAAGVRIDSPPHIRAVRARVDAPLIGLWKKVLPGYEVYITPQFQHAQEVAQAGADLIAIDATQRPRPGGEQLAELIRRIHTELNLPVMADVASFDEALVAEAAGADVVGTTLYGYTAETKQATPPGFELLAAMVATLKVPVICEGGIASPEMVRKALDLGAFTVVVGTAITGIDAKVQAFMQAL
ncbi:N-acetylmannosamine-6-phosphate 2-epimerase [Leptolyngbya sp. FACHB-261]|uniref:N-acetylmannosamine-6-phosphate 2-epimerase n=1 Tax=Leptolyngbya sp. FACHB-261 TaxID=2692806 RepID=UPI00168854EE|nr:N-acetylmannosamine-6-phosphate 2-epimerase [Leptolyngbya sp. FACHB-261]MBD2099328.1 N-acetylmannosamine-6-phosphate 2-epimerase [Leptolyngbya sp. FACHB-261]